MVLITGSGPQDRDETLFGKHKPFRHLTHALCEAGYAVFRYDDRGVGGSTGNFFASGLSDFVSDATAVVRQLAKHPHINRNKLILLGHSEGAYIASQIARQTPSIAGIISLAGPALSTEQTLLSQLDAIARSAGTAEADLIKIRQLNQQIYTLMKDKSLPLDSVKARVSTLYRTHPEVKKFGLTERQLLSQLTPYLRELLTIDIEGTWRGVTAPVIGIYGGKDLQVLPEHAQALKKLLPKAEVQVIADVNHLFLPSATGSPAEYAGLQPGFSPEAIRVLLKALDKLR